MNNQFVEAVISLLMYYFDSVVEVDRALVGDILEGIQRLLK